MQRSLTLIGNDVVAEETRRFRFQKPADFIFEAGQYVELTLIDPVETDAEGNTRAFSICSGPQESELWVATRMRDTAFKRTISALPTGSVLHAEGPLGSFLLHEDTNRPAVFLAGGIGITPFRSMIINAAARAVARPLYLFYSNRRPEDAPFLDELTTLANTWPSFVCVPTMTNAEHSAIPWQGERGYIDAAMLERYVPRGGDPIYYLAGPQAMVGALRDLLITDGVSKDAIRFEEFSGY